VCTDYDGKIVCGIYEDYDIEYTEGEYKIGVIIESEDEVLKDKGYKLGRIPSATAAVCYGIFIL